VLFGGTFLKTVECFSLLEYGLIHFHAIMYQAMCRDSRIVPGAAATEIELAKRVKDFSFGETGYFLFSFSVSNNDYNSWGYIYLGFFHTHPSIQYNYLRNLFV